MTDGQVVPAKSRQNEYLAYNCDGAKSLHRNRTIGTSPVSVWEVLPLGCDSPATGERSQRTFCQFQAEGITAGQNVKSFSCLSNFPLQRLQQLFARGDVEQA